MKICRNALPLLVAPLLVVSTGSAQAIDFGAGLLIKHETTDNVDRVDVGANPQDGSRQEIIGTVSGSTRAQLLDMDFDLSLGYSTSDSEIDDASTDLRGGMYALFNLRPGQISWLLADYVLQQGEDLAALANTEDRYLGNYFVTGPSTHWRVSPVDTFNADLFYLLADEEGDDEQTRQLTLQTDWSHRFSRKHALGLHFENSDITFKESSDKFNLVNTFARYNYIQGKTLFNIDAGESRSEEEVLEDGSATVTKTDESLFRFALSRQMSRELSLTFEGSRAFTDETMSTLRDLQANLSAGVDTGSGPFYEKRVALGMNRGGDVWNGGLRVSNTDMEFVDTGEEDRAVERLSLELGYSLSGRWGLSMRTAVAEIDYQNIERLDKEISYGAGVSYQLTATWGAALEAGFSEVDSERSDEDDELIKENELSLSVYWQPQTKLSRMREKYERKQIENVLK